MIRHNLTKRILYQIRKLDFQRRSAQRLFGGQDPVSQNPGTVRRQDEVDVDWYKWGDSLGIWDGGILKICSTAFQVPPP